MVDYFLSINEAAIYPKSNYDFNPYCNYPEYFWGENYISLEKNDIYDMVRNSFIGLELDKENIGTKDWNPLGSIIEENQTVLIKPNWVMHTNNNKSVKEDAMECLITHPSIIRAVVDYVLIALNGTGKIIIGDAPMQGCDINKLFSCSGYYELFKFYDKNSIDIKPIDFRKYRTICDSNKIIINKEFNNNECIEVNLGKLSKHYYIGKQEKQYKVSDYSKNLTNSCHHEEIHKYYISKEVLSADVVINIPKPKCHRLGGITAALKNMVGITFDKSCLPHRTMGSRTEGGDEYLNRSQIKKITGNILELKLYFEEKKAYIPALFMRYSYGVLYYIIKVFLKDKYLIGSWYGNDTIWRTVYDLNYILIYADKNGKIQENAQRKVLNIADMIIGGQGNGPVSPEPKHLGVLVAGYNSVVLDRIVCEIMGFDYKKVPGLAENLNDIKLTNKKIDNYIISSNINKYDNKGIEELKFPEEWEFKPHEMWKGHIEKV